MPKTEVSTAVDLADLALSGNSSAVLPEAGTTASTAAASGSPAPAATPVASNPAAVRPSGPQPATLAELKAIAGDDSTFILSQLEAGATLQAASNAYIAKVKAENAELKTKATAATIAATAEPLRKPGLATGVSALAGKQGTAGSTEGDAAIDAFNDAVLAEMDRRKCSKHVAHASVCRQRPDLRQAYLAAHNAMHAAKR